MDYASPSPAFPLAPGSLPLVGHLPRIHLDVLGLLRSAAARLGPVFRLDHGFGSRPTYVYGDEGFTLLRNDRVDSSANLELARILLEGSLIPEDGANHRRMRGAIDAPFSLRGLESSNVGEIIADVVSRRLAGWSDDRPLPIVTEASEITLAVVFRIMGIEPGEIPKWHKKYRDYTLGVINEPFELPGSPRWRAKRAIAWIDEQFTRLVSERRRQGDRRSFLGAMVHGEDAEGQRMSHAELLGNLRLLGFAGHETTASVMTWMMIRLGSDRALWQRLCDEALAADGPPLVPSVLSRFPFAEALFREAARVYPPAWFVMRRTLQTIDFEGVAIPAGHLLILPIVAWSRSPSRYPDPDRFDPDRWLRHEQARHPIETCQFGGGPHFCLGYRLALLEGIHFIVAVARRLGARGLRPVLRGPVPPPRYLPFTRAPARTALHLEPAR